MEMQTWRNALATAQTASRALQAALAGLGIPERACPLIRPVVSTSGRAYVEVGLLRPEVAEHVAEALRLWAVRPPPPSSGPTELRWLDTGSGPGAMVPVTPTAPDGDVPA
ncbi:hypothetical protein ACIBCM_14120 [Streptomyces sp. NPDC051018]|uniref:hypothetical protein n=1 Tax=Streptomyces sp. NPDC051018 TaxID=3365639 RepID=UPI0037AF79F6